MKIPSITNSLNKTIFKPIKIGLVAGLSFLPVQMFAPEKMPAKDIFEHIELAKQIPKAKPLMNLRAPNPNIKVAGELKKASVVVDTENNKLYHYDKEGNFIKEYNVATGKSSTPTDKGIKKITWFENYPYRNAPEISKRRKAPWDYGPKVIVLGFVDEKTGEVTHFNGEFIHGTNKPESIGTHASKGCVRMHNEDVLELASQLEKDMYVVFK